MQDIYARYPLSVGRYHHSRSGDTMKCINRCMAGPLLASLLASWGCMSGPEAPVAGEQGDSPALELGPRSADLLDASRPVAIPSRVIAASAKPSEGAMISATTTEVFVIANFTSTAISTFNGSVLSGTPNAPLPSPIPSLMASVGVVSVPAALSWSQVIDYTTNTADPFGAAKSCQWLVTTTFNFSCTASVSSVALGQQGALCGFDPSQSGVDPTSCALQVVLGIQ